MAVPQYPIHLNLIGRDVLVVGGGRVAARKVAGLVEAGATVRVLSATFVAELEHRTDVAREKGPYSPHHIGSATLVFACTDDSETNRRIAADSRAAGALCNIADDPDASDFHLPAVLRSGELTISVGTGGAAPHLAAALRDRLQSQFSAEWGILVEELAQARSLVLERVADSSVRHDLLATLAGDSSVELLMRSGRDAWRTWFEKLLAESCGSSGDHPAQA